MVCVGLHALALLLVCGEDRVELAHNLVPKPPPRPLLHVPLSQHLLGKQVLGEHGPPRWRHRWVSPGQSGSAQGSARSARGARTLGVPQHVPDLRRDLLADAGARERSPAAAELHAPRPRHSDQDGGAGDCRAQREPSLGPAPRSHRWAAERPARSASQTAVVSNLGGSTSSWTMVRVLATDDSATSIFRASSFGIWHAPCAHACRHLLASVHRPD